MSYQMLYIIFASGKKVIKTDNPVTLVYQTRTKMRTYKARTATYQAFFILLSLYYISFVKQNKQISSIPANFKYNIITYICRHDS